MNFVCIGNAASKLGELLSGSFYYNSLAIANKSREIITFQLPEFYNPEKYEEWIIQNSELVIEFINKNTNDKNLVFVVNGGSISSAIILPLLKFFEDIEPMVLYLEPDVAVLNRTQRMHERVCYYVLQEYARSGKFRKLYLCSNTLIAEQDNLPIQKLYEGINYRIAYNFHFLNLLNQEDAIYENTEYNEEMTRIFTIGEMNIEAEEQNLFAIQNVTDLRYLIHFPTQTIHTRQLNNLIKELKEKYILFDKKPTISYKFVNLNGNKENFIITEYGTHFIQYREEDKKRLEL